MAFSIVRPLEISESKLSILFNDELAADIGVSNILISSEELSVPNPKVRSVVVLGEVIDIYFDPVFRNVKYKLTLSSTAEVGFSTKKGEIISEDGHRNTLFFSSPIEKENPIDVSIKDQLAATNVYDVDGKTLVSDWVSALVEQIENAIIVKKTTKSGNYLSIREDEELKVRGYGPTDLIDNGGAYKIHRVSRDRAGGARQGKLEYDSSKDSTYRLRAGVVLNPLIASFSYDPVSLQSKWVRAEKVSNEEEVINGFDGLTIKVSRQPVIQVISVSLFQDNNWYEYNIRKYGYSLKSNRYDTALSFSDPSLQENEIKLSAGSLIAVGGDFPYPRAGSEIQVSYVYKDLGRSIESAPVLSSVEDSFREAVPAITNRFSLKHAPIVTGGDAVPSSDGVQFLSSGTLGSEIVFTTTHPAFLKESKSGFARFAGEFSVDYLTGEVTVYGKDGDADGTGEYPPVATYKYRKIFVEGLDYFYDSVEKEIALNPSQNLYGIEAKISFTYEDTFAEGRDYVVRSHNEALNERVYNRLRQENIIKTLNFPITNVFRVLNETTGEIYGVTRFNDTSITITGRNLPEQKDANREKAEFSGAQDVLVATDELVNAHAKRVLEINLRNSGVTDGQNRFVGASFDSSVVFSETDIFRREFFYDTSAPSLVSNTDKLTEVGDYVINYVDGIVYVAVEESQGDALGDISYKYHAIATKNNHVVDVNNIFRSTGAQRQNVSTYETDYFGDSYIYAKDIEEVGERFINGNQNRPIVVGSLQSGEDGVVVNGSYGFVSNSAIFDETHVGKTIRIGTADLPPVGDFTITQIINDKEVLLDSALTYSDVRRPWVLVDLSEGAEKTIALKNTIISVNNVYKVSDLATKDSQALDGYFDISSDSFDGNTITLSETNSLAIGDAVLVNYNYGNIFVDYRYLADELVISYEYGKNSLDWSISTALYPGQEYYVTYSFGALRDFLLRNFGALTQIPQLMNFSTGINRELYRSVLQGTLQSFAEGPTKGSISRLVESFTDAPPKITESAFQGWVLGRDYFNKSRVTSETALDLDIGRFGNGIFVGEGQSLSAPAVSNLRLGEGTMSMWVRPGWDGDDSDARLTFDIKINGVTADPAEVFIGFGAKNPSSVPFSLGLGEADLDVIGEPPGLMNSAGVFIWYTLENKKWNFWWAKPTGGTHIISATVKSSGEFYGTGVPIHGEGGFYINEITDSITSMKNAIYFESSLDGYDVLNHDGYGIDGYGVGFVQDGLYFSSGQQRFLFDMYCQETENRMSLYKDGLGYLNFSIRTPGFYDNQINLYNIATNIRTWTSDRLYHIAAAWKTNQTEEKDEMHLFVNGQEVPSLFRYGGSPAINVGGVFGGIAKEEIITNSVKQILGGVGGATTAGSDLFVIDGADFTVTDIAPGDELHLLDETPDAGSYTIVGVGESHIQIGGATFLLSLSNLRYSINRAEVIIRTPVNFQDFAVFRVNPDGTETELNGINAIYPDYSISRNSENFHTISIENGVALGDSVIVRPLGLIFRRCLENVFVFGGQTNDYIKTKSPPPASLEDVNITYLLQEKTEILDGYSYFPRQPSNVVDGRTIQAYASGDNIDYSSAKITIRGETYPGVYTEEELVFSSGGTLKSDGYWTKIDEVVTDFDYFDGYEPIGVFEIRESRPINRSDNNGDFVEIVEYANGNFYLEIYGSGGLKYYPPSGWYEIDYPSFLKIKYSSLPSDFHIGSDYSGNNYFNGTVDEVRILDKMSYDTRVGEPIFAGEKNITTEYYSPTAISKDINTLFLLNCDKNIKNTANFMDKFDQGFEVAPSVNLDFGTGIKISENRAFVIDNAAAVFNNDEGTVEFWVSPLEDTKNNPNYHYYLDMAAIIEEELVSITPTTVIIPNKVRSVESVRLLSDIYNTGINYFVGGSVSSIDAKTVTLGIRLPSQNTPVKVVYTPIDNQGDRVSVFRSPGGFVNFFVRASEKEHLISYHTNWNRNSWNRIVVMWSTNNLDGKDRLRLFVNGVERGTIRYGTGLIYGTGVLWGQEEIRPGQTRFLADTIRLTDTFSKINVGTDVFGLNGARSVVDNLRFSNEQRLSMIKTVGSGSVDINYKDNRDFAVPVTEDIITTGLYNFDREPKTINNLVKVIDAKRGIFRFYVDVEDPFDKMYRNQELNQLLRDLIDTIKPGHSESIIIFPEDRE